MPKQDGDLEDLIKKIIADHISGSTKRFVMSSQFPFTIHDYDVGLDGGTFIQEPIQYGNNMAWNYEKGCEEPIAYDNAAMRTPGSPSDPAIPGKTWEEYESDLILLRKKGVTGTILAITEQLAKNLYTERVNKMAAAKNITEYEARRAYVAWLSEQGSLRLALPDDKKEIESIKDLPPMERIITAGYRHLAKQYHPDMETGDRNKFEELKLAKLKLDKLVEEMKGLLS